MSHQLFDLSGRVAVVTGGAGIYGKAISEGLAESGALVVIASRDLAACEVQAHLLADRGLAAGAASYDQGSESSILAFRDHLLAKYGVPDVFVNNSVGRSMAGYGGPVDGWRTSMDVNGTGLFTISRAFLDPMMERGTGSMINIASIQAVVAPDFQNYQGTSMSTPPDYHFHKHGMIGLTKYLAAVAGPRGVRVNAVSPGGTRTESHPATFVDEYCRRVFLGRMAKPGDIKGAVIFLASDASAYVTAQNLIVDGGYTA